MLDSKQLVATGWSGQLWLVPMFPVSPCRRRQLLLLLPQLVWKGNIWILFLCLWQSGRQVSLKTCSFFRHTSHVCWHNWPTGQSFHSSFLNFSTLVIAFNSLKYPWPPASRRKHSSDCFRCFRNKPQFGLGRGQQTILSHLTIKVLGELFV